MSWGVAGARQPSLRPHRLHRPRWWWLRRRQTWRRAPWRTTRVAAVVQLRGGAMTTGATTTGDTDDDTTIGITRNAAAVGGGRRAAARGPALAATTAGTARRGRGRGLVTSSGVRTRGARHGLAAGSDGRETTARRVAVTTARQGMGAATTTVTVNTSATASRVRGWRGEVFASAAVRVGTTVRVRQTSDNTRATIMRAMTMRVAGQSSGRVTTKTDGTMKGVAPPRVMPHVTTCEAVVPGVVVVVAWMVAVVVTVRVSGLF